MLEKEPFRLNGGGLSAGLQPRSHSLVLRVTGNHVSLGLGSSNPPLGAFCSSLSPLQLIAKASSAALELAETGDLEPALKVLSQLAKIWK